MQLHTSSTIKFFHETFKNKFGFSDYKSLDEPTVFFGLYNNKDLNILSNHRGIKILWLAGYDATQTSMLSILKKNNINNLTIIAESKWIEGDLDTAGLKYVPISIFMDNLYSWNSVPLGDSLYWYNANNSRYGKEYLDEVRKCFPDLNIITNDAHTTPRSEMHKIYAQCFAGVRPVNHDGMSQGVAEMGLMGRYTIWNGGGPFAIPFSGLDGILRAIEGLRSVKYNYRLISKRSRGYFIENERKWTNLVLSLCGTTELEIAGIFNEDRGRCGSIFRIMRTSVVNNMTNKFGLDQFERPYISEQLQKIGLKEIITSKNSGFIVSEWKSLYNKGYAPGFKEFNTYDKKYS